MHITKSDVLWNYAATFLKMASSALLLPFILRMMPAETVGIWIVFMTITSFSGLLDFGFNPSFARNVTYIFSGVRSLKIVGFELVNTEHVDIDFGLLKGVITAMQWYYRRIALILFLLLATVGTWYISSIIENYKNNPSEVYIAWGMLCLINSYNIYTLYYESLLLGKGLIKKSKKIIITGNLVYVIIAALLVMAGRGLLAIIAAQALSVIIIRWLAHRAFFTSQLNKKLHNTVARSKTEILKAVTPNAVKIGISSIGGFMVARSAIIIGSLYLPLTEIASYGVTIQLIGVIASLAEIFIVTYSPKIAQLRVGNNVAAIKHLYLKGEFILMFTFVSCGFVLAGLGDWVLQAIGSKTPIMARSLLVLSLIVAFLESNHSIAGSILLTKNEVPFFKASIISGGATVLILFILFNTTHWGVLAMIAAPGIVQGLYQNWKWPLSVLKELKISLKDLI